MRLNAFLASCGVASRRKAEDLIRSGRVDVNGRIILAPFFQVDPGTDENVMWGLGELAGTGIGDDASFALIKRKMKDPDASVRGMAAWAAGRYRHRLSMTDEESEVLLTELLEDDSPLVKASAEFALADEESK